MWTLSLIISLVIINGRNADSQVGGVIAMTDTTSQLGA